MRPFVHPLRPETGCAAAPCGQVALTQRTMSKIPPMKTKSELLKDARSQVPEVQPVDLSRQPRSGDRGRPRRTDRRRMLPAPSPSRGSGAADRGDRPDRGADVVLYCAGGTRSLLAARTLKDMGIRGPQPGRSFSAWKSAGCPGDPGRLTDAQRARYSRHLIIPEWRSGQASCSSRRCC